MLNTPPADNLDPKSHVAVSSTPASVALNTPPTGNRHLVFVMNNLDPEQDAVVLNAPPASNVETWHPFSSNRVLIGRECTSWQIREKLGSGSYGDVYKGSADDGFIFAVKVAPLSDNDKRKQLEHEISILRPLKHKNVVQYLGRDKDSEKLYLFLELMPYGSLDTLCEKRSLTESKVSKITRQILKGLKFLHSKNVMHRDIKCANILLGKGKSAKLADFGFAKDTNISAAKSPVGTTLYMAPEVVGSEDKVSYGSAVDIWSLGCTVLEMLTGKPPYPDSEEWRVRRKIMDGESPKVPEHLSKVAQNFILRCLQENPSDRPTAAELLEDPFVRKPPTSTGFASPHFNNIGS